MIKVMKTKHILSFAVAWFALFSKISVSIAFLCTKSICYASHDDLTDIESHISKSSNIRKSNGLLSSNLHPSSSSSSFANNSSLDDADEASIDETQEFLANQDLVWSVLNKKGDTTDVLKALSAQSETKFDINGLNWALSNALIEREIQIEQRAIHEDYKSSIFQDFTHGPNSEIIQLLSTQYRHLMSKPDDKGICYAFELGLKINNDKMIFDVLELAIQKRQLTLKKVLHRIELGMRVEIVNKLVDSVLNTKIPLYPLPDTKSLILAIIKFKIEGREDISDKIFEFVSKDDRMNAELWCNSLYHAFKYVHDIYKKNQKDEHPNYIEYLRRKEIFENNIDAFNFASFEIFFNYYPDALTSLKEMWNDMLIESSQFEDFQMGIDLLNQKYEIFFDQTVLRKAIDITNKHLKKITPKRKRDWELIAKTSEDKTPNGYTVLQRLVSLVKQAGKPLTLHNAPEVILR